MDDVENFATKPEEFVKFYDPPKNYDVSLEINQILDEAQRALEVIDISTENRGSEKIEFDSLKNKLSRILLDIKVNVNDMGLWGGNRGVVLHLFQLSKLKSFNPQVFHIIVLSNLNLINFV